MLPLQARVNLGAMAMKGYSAFPKAPAILEPRHQIASCHFQDTHWGGSYPLCKEAVGVFYSPSWLCQQKKNWRFLSIQVFWADRFMISEHIDYLNQRITQGRQFLRCSWDPFQISCNCFNWTFAYLHVSMANHQYILFQIVFLRMV